MAADLTLWKQLYQALGSLMDNQDPQNLVIQSPGVKELYDWNIELLSEAPLSIDQYNFCNTIPNGSAGGVSKFDAAYKSFVMEGIRISQGDNSDLDKINNEIIFLGSQNIKLNDACHAAFLKEPVGLYTSYQEYKTESGVQGEMDANSDNRKQLYDEVKAIGSGDNYTATHAKSIVDDPQTKTQYGTTLESTWTVSPSPADANRQLDDIGSGTPLQLKITNASTQYDYTKVHYAARSLDFFFFSISLGGAYTRVHINSSAKEFRLDMSFDNVVRVDVTAGDWYDSAVFNLIDDPTNLSAGWSKFKAAGKTYVCGYGGQVNSMMDYFMVYKSMKLVVSLDKADYEYLKQQRIGGAGFRIGPFSFGGGGDDVTSTSINTDDRAMSITCKLDSTVPIVLCKHATVLGNPPRQSSL